MALVLVALLAFAAFAIDLGAAWAERRTDQSGADAGVMAGAIEIVVGAPTQAEVVDVVRDYVERNIGLPAASPDWLTCVDPGRGASYTPLVDSGGNTIDCISVTTDGPGGPSVILRTKVPDQQVDTFFAPVIGIDTLTVDAEAEAEIKAGIAGEGGIIPFALPHNYSTEDCLGTPPSGLIPEDTVCQGPSQGNFGIVDSPHFGELDEPHGTVLTCPPSDVLARVSHQVAIGIDHLISIYTGPPLPPPYPSNSRPAEGADDCPEPLFGKPWVLNTRTGDPFASGGGGQWPPVPVSPNVAVAVGLVGDGLFGNLGGTGQIGRLRRTGGLNSGSGDDVRELATTSNPFLAFDNVGLWEYLDPALDGTSGPCDRTLWTGTGTVWTEMMRACIDSGAASFIDDIFSSPRYALVPLLWYEECGPPSNPICLSGQQWVYIIGLRPIYLQSTWYTCGGSSYCIWKSTDGLFLQVFNPGEGTVNSCEGVPDDGVNPGSCTGIPNPNQVRLRGLSAFVLEWGYLSDEADPTGTGSPFFAELYR